MASLATNLAGGSFVVPTQVLDPWLGKIQYGSVVAALSNQIPMKFGAGSSMTFDIGEAELVGEGAEKGATTYTNTSTTVEPKKFHKTLRFNEEVLWADEDYQLGVVQDILDQIQPALSRALDFGVLHALNPATGIVAPSITQAVKNTTNSVEYVETDAPYVSLDEADALVLANGYVPRDVALDPAYAAKFASLRNDTSSQKQYPDLRLSTEVGNLDGHRSSVSRTVGAAPLAVVPTDVLGFVGDFSAIRWGVQKAIGLELIRYGNPDGLGDLKRQNQVAFRAEVVYGWGIADLNAFAKVVDATPAP